MVDYSKWDKMKFSDSDEEAEAAAAPRPPPPRSAPPRDSSRTPPSPPPGETPAMRLLRELANDLAALVPQLTAPEDAADREKLPEMVALVREHLRGGKALSDALLVQLHGMRVLLRRRLDAREEVTLLSRELGAGAQKRMDDCIAAIQADDATKLASLFDAQPPLRASGPTGLGMGGTWLHFAAVHGGARVVRFLLQRGAPLDEPDGILDTPLHNAARDCNAPVVEVLLSAGADVSAVNKTQSTALHLAVMRARLRRAAGRGRAAQRAHAQRRLDARHVRGARRRG